MFKRMFSRLIVLMLIATCVCRHAGAKFARAQTENVPIERVLQNLERRAEEKPKDFSVRMNLGRVHAMAYASKSETFEVHQNTNEPSFGPFGGQFNILRIKQAPDAQKLRLAREHLAKAIQNYEAAIAIKPSSLVAKLGRAWCLDQSGDRQRARAAYREILKEQQGKETSRDLPELQNLTPLTEEVAGYLIRLLDPVKDAAEIGNVQARVAKVRAIMATRPITPIAIPLKDQLSVNDLVERNSPVVFDADGSGLPKRWTWISTQAGWLVFDKSGRKEITSALELFGNVTFWLFWDNGYQALAALDDDGDGELRGTELDGLAIWRDANRNGIADPGEVRTLAEWHIKGLSLQFEQLDDDPSAWSQEGVVFEDGTIRPTFDLLLYPR